jgi:hypothetical protein
MTSQTCINFYAKPHNIYSNVAPTCLAYFPHFPIIRSPANIGCLFFEDNVWPDKHFMQSITSIEEHILDTNAGKQLS